MLMVIYGENRVRDKLHSGQGNLQPSESRFLTRLTCQSLVDSRVCDMNP
jgi:hypothetical protein